MTTNLFLILLIYIPPLCFVFWMIRDAHRCVSQPKAHRFAKNAGGAIPQMNQEHLGDGLFPGGIGGTG
jgi:hypothetical protein